jgi:hypothetical protein
MRGAKQDRVVAASEAPEPAIPTVAIVGLGPKGLYCLERLVAEFGAHPLPGGLRVAVFNRSEAFGASPVYDPAEPDFLLVNVSVGEIDLWDGGDPAIDPERGPDFLSWYRAEFRPTQPLSGDEYLSRAVVGRYLHDGFERVISHLPRGMTVECFVAEVIDIAPTPAAHTVTFVDGIGQQHSLAVDKILLATGHSRVAAQPEEQRYQRFADRQAGASYIPFVYPVSTLDAVPAGARVAMKGIGLTFVDAVLALTEGRGGVFERMADGRLSYRASGREPEAIIPFSRTGLPMAPKPHDLPATLRPLTFVTPDRLATLRRQSDHGQIDIDRDVWPLFELEMEHQYYRVVMGDDDRSRLEACGDDGGALREVVDTFLRSHPDQERFDYRPILDPVGERRFACGGEFQAFVEHYMDEEIERARLGLARSGIKAAIATWYEVRTALSPFVVGGGLTPSSHRRLAEHYRPVLKRVVFGPPIISIEKLLAIQRAGLLDFSVARSPRVLTDESDGCFELRCDSIPGATTRADVLVDARYPPVDIDHDATPLYVNLRRRGIVRAFENQSMGVDQAPYRPGAIDMTTDTRFVIGAQGTPNEDIAVIGIPTEGNLVGNFSVTRDRWAGVWAREVLRQLRGRASVHRAPEPGPT